MVPGPGTGRRSGRSLGAVHPPSPEVTPARCPGTTSVTTLGVAGEPVNDTLWISGWTRWGGRGAFLWNGGGGPCEFQAPSILRCLLTWQSPVHHLWTGNSPGAARQPGAAPPVTAGSPATGNSPDTPVTARQAAGPGQPGCCRKGARWTPAPGLPCRRGGDHPGTRPPLLQWRPHTCECAVPAICIPGTWETAPGGPCPAVSAQVSGAGRSPEKSSYCHMKAIVKVGGALAHVPQPG